MSQKKGLKRNTIDKYYTRDTVVNMCVDIMKLHLTLSKKDLIIEPSAGNGSFIGHLKKLSKNHLFYDIEPEHDDIVKQNYLELDNDKILSMPHKRIHVVGNPPFGRQASMAIKFIKKSCQFCDTLSFVLPKSFKKDSLKKTFPLDFHLVTELELPPNAFLVDGKEHDVPCVFQVWEKRSYCRAVPSKLEPSNFQFVKQEDNPDISFRRVGVNAGKIDVNTIDKSPQSHYFIRFTNEKSVVENIEALSNITYDFNNTVGPKSISKQELIQKFNPLLTPS